MPSGPRIVQVNEEDDNQLALELGDDQNRLSMDILNQIGNKIRADEMGPQQIKKSDTLKVEDYNDGGALDRLEGSIAGPN